MEANNSQKRMTLKEWEAWFKNNPEQPQNEEKLYTEDEAIGAIQRKMLFQKLLNMLKKKKNTKRE